MCLLDLLLRSCKSRGRDGRLPELVKVRPFAAPQCAIAHCGSSFGYVLKGGLGVGVGEGVKESHTSVELLLNDWVAGDGERYFFPSFLGCRVVVGFLCGGEGL